MSKKRIIRKLLENELTIEELSMLEKKSFDKDELKDYAHIIEQAKNLARPEINNIEELKKNLFNKLEEPKSTSMLSILPMGETVKKVFAVAASIILFVCVYIVFFSKTIYSTGYEEMKAFTLPDGSSVKLNADSYIKFNKFGWKSNRTMELEGEAFFEVTSGSPFKVTSSDGFGTEVLGTTFNIKSRFHFYEVKCFSGKVAVSTSSDTTKITLTKGLFTKRIDNSKLSVPTSFSTDKKMLWQNGYFYFNGDDLSLAIDELQRQYGIKIILADPNSLNNRKYYGYFTNKDLNKALESVLTPMNFSYKIDQDKKVVYLE